MGYSDILEIPLEKFYKSENLHKSILCGAECNRFADFLRKFRNTYLGYKENKYAVYRSFKKNENFSVNEIYNSVMNNDPNYGTLWNFLINYGFLIACHHGHLDTAKILKYAHPSEIDHHMFDDICYRQDHPELYEWLVSECYNPYHHIKASY